VTVLPDRWTLTSLGEIAVEVRNGVSTTPSEEGSQEILRISAVRPMRLDMTDVRFLPGPSDQWSRYRIQANDLLFTRYNGNPHLVGACARVTKTPERPIVYPDKLIRVRLHEGIACPAFIEKAVNVGVSRVAIEQKVKTSAGQVGIAGGDLKDVPIPLPPPAEQHRIAAKIEAITPYSRRAKEAIDAIPPLLERFRQSVLATAFRGDLTAAWREKNPDVEPAEELLKRIRAERRRLWEEAELAKMRAKGKAPTDDRWKEKYEEPVAVDASELPDLPDGWCWTAIGEVFNVAIGATPSRAEPAYWNGDIPWVSSGEVAFCRISSTRERITELGLKNSSTELHPPGTVLLGMIGEGKTRGQTAILEVAACNNQNSAAIRVSETPVPAEYVYRYLESEYERTRRGSSGNNQPALNKSRVQAIPFPLAPGPEQVKIVRHIESVLALADRVRMQVGSMQDDLSSLDRAILTKAFRGELVPQDPNDEPASVLLERIRAERAQAPAAKPDGSKRARGRAYRSTERPR
jgi:type I restriction enzyme S subunit